MKILVLNGPNLNLLGQREPGIYGRTGLEEILESLRRRYADRLELQTFQSNHEGALIDRLQQAYREGVEGVVLNAGAYTHTSIALHDAIRKLPLDVLERNRMVPVESLPTATKPSPAVPDTPPTHPVQSGTTPP